MGIFSNILNKIFPSDHPAVAAASTSESAAAPAMPPTVPAASSSAVPVSAPIPTVDVEQVLTEMGSKNSEKLNWQTSIVDLMKLLGLDSSLGSRKDLATELHYSGDMNDSAAMNVWLHKQVMAKLAANGGKVPADLQ